MYQVGKRKYLSDFVSGFIAGARMAGASTTKTAQLAGVSIRAVTTVTSVFRSMGKTSVSRLVNCVRHLMAGVHANI